MARTRKSIQPLNLYKYDVLIEDRGTRSDYFKISQFDGYFYGGRNAFLVAGAGVLQPNSKILVEVLNKDGTTVYSAPATQFIEGNSRLVQVEVYSDTPIGAGKIVLLGCTTTYADGTPVPDEWKDKYNVRWITDVIISPLVENKTQIRFVNQPSVVAQEKFYFSPSASIYTEQVNVPVDIKISPKYLNVFPNGYQVEIKGPGNTRYFSEYLNGIITGSIIISSSTVSETASIELPITKIFNSSLAESVGKLLYTDKNNIILEGVFSSSGAYTTSLKSFGTVQVLSNINLRYSKLETFDTGSAVSYAKLRIVDAKPLSGEVHHVRLSHKASTQPGEFINLADAYVSVQELFAVDSASRIAETGRFRNIVINDYWYSATMSLARNQINPSIPTYYNSSSLISSSSLQIVQCCVDLLDSINATPTIVSGGYTGNTSYFIGNRKENSVQLFPRSEYTLAFDAFVTKQSASVDLSQNDYSLEVYLVSQENSEVRLLQTDTRGQLLGVLTPESNFQRQNFEKVEFNFTPKIIESGKFGLRFVFYGGFWNIANVSLKTAQEPFFSPDEIDILVPLVDYEEDILEFRAEYLNVNHNAADIITISTPTYITGSRKYVKRSGDTMSGPLYVNGSISASSFIGFMQSASYALTASYAMNGGGGGGGLSGGTTNYIPLWTSTTAQSSSNVYQSGSKIGIGTITPSANLQVQGNISASSFTGSIFGTSSWASNAISASSATSITFIPLTASFATSASYAPTILPTGVVSSSTQASAWTVSSASFATSASYAPIILPDGTISSSVQVDYTQIQNQPTVIPTASYIDYTNVTNKPTLVSASSQINTGSFSGSITTASYAVTASYALNISGTIASATTSSFSITSSYITPSGLPSGTVSSSTQINYTQIQNQPTTIATASYVEYSNVVNKPTLVSSSVQINTGSFSGSITTASYAITASYVLPTGLPSGTVSSSIQTITNITNQNVTLGNVTSSNLLVQGNLQVLGSASIQYVTSSQLVISNNKIILNDDDIVRFAGMSIYDSGSSSPTTASIYWDSLNHKFLYENLSGSDYKSAWFIAGPKNTGSLGQETGLTTGKIPVASGDDHISNSQISDNGVLVTIPNNLYVGGSVTSSFSGSLVGTASWANNAVTSSFSTTSSAATSITFTPATASFATTASAANSITFVPSTASFATTASTATSITFIPSTSSFATTASAATSITFTPASASFATTASYVNSFGLPNGTVSSSQQINTGSFTGSFIGLHTSSVIGVGFLGTASWAQNAITASYAANVSAADWNTLLNKPSGVVSSSNQVNTGSFTGSFIGDATGLFNIPYISNTVIDVYTFTGDGSTVSYMVSKSYYDTSLFVSLNGLNQTQNIDYTRSGTNIQFISTPPSESNILIRGLVNAVSGSTGSYSGSFIGDASGLINIPYNSNTVIDTYTFAGDGITTSYNITKNYYNTSVFVSVDGLTQLYTTDYNLSGTNLQFVAAPPSESNILVRAFVNTTSGSIGTYSGSFLGTATSASYAVTSSYVLTTGLPTGVVSSSTQTVTNISGQTISPAGISSSNNIIPTVDNNYNLGSPSNRWANLYTGDLNLSNEGSAGNIIDGTTGNWTIQEGENNLYIINNKNGKKFKIMLTEIE